MEEVHDAGRRDQPRVEFRRGALVTYLLVRAIMALAVDRRAPASWAALMIGLAVTCDIIVFARQ